MLNFVDFFLLFIGYGRLRFNLYFVGFFDDKVNFFLKILSFICFVEFSSGSLILIFNLFGFVLVLVFGVLRYF